MLSKAQIQELGPRIKNRDSEAFHILYRECFEPLQRYAMRYVYDWQEAEDMVQNAFFVLLLNLHKYDCKQDIFTYLFVHVKNGCLNYNRNLKIKDSHQDKVIEALLFSHIEDPELDPDIKRRLESVLSSMSGQQREAVLKHIIERKKMSEIAQELDIAESTAITHFKRGMKILRQNLKFIFLPF